MDYSLSNTYEYVMDLLDKKGSDLIQLPEMFRVFKTATIDFIGERLPVIEKTQQITEDLRPLMDIKKIPVANNPTDPYSTIASVPSYVDHLVRANPMFANGTSGRRPKLIKHGNIDAYFADPNKRPSEEYPLIVQYLDYVKIFTGYNIKPINVLMTYLKKPDYALLSNQQQRICNLPDSSIEDIINKTVLILSGVRGDERIQIHGQKEQSFRNPRG